MKTVEVGKTTLRELLAEVQNGSAVVLTENARPVATISPVEPEGHTATEAMVQQRREALRELRGAGGLRSVIADPAEWQRAMRVDRPLPNAG